MQPLKPYEKRDTLRQFLDHDGHVLRFYCVWDDRDSNEFGDVRQVAPPCTLLCRYWLHASRYLLELIDRR